MTPSSTEHDGRTGAPPTGRKQWRYQEKVNDFNKSHRYGRYAPDYFTMLEREMRDPTLNSLQRFMAGMKRFSWGNLSDVVVDCMPKLGTDDPEPRPLTQAKFAELTGMSSGAVSEAATFYRNTGYLRADHPHLYLEDQRPICASHLSPSESVSLLGTSIHNVPIDDVPNQPAQAGTSNSDVLKNASRFVDFRAAYLEVHPEDAEEIRIHLMEAERLEAIAQPYLQAARQKRDAAKSVELKKILPAWKKDKKRHGGTGETRGRGEQFAPTAVARDARDSGALDSDVVNPVRTLDSDMHAKSFTTFEENFRNVQTQVQDAETPEPLNQPISSADVQAPLKSLIPEMVTEESTIGRSVPVQPDDRPTDGQTEGRAQYPFRARLREWLESTIALPVPLEDPVLDAIAATIHSELHLKQFQQAALRQRDPRWWKVFVTIAGECQKHHERYKEAAAGLAHGKPQESEVSKRYREREEREQRKGGSRGPAT